MATNDDFYYLAQRYGEKLRLVVDDTDCIREIADELRNMADAWDASHRAHQPKGKEI